MIAQRIGSRLAGALHARPAGPAAGDHHSHSQRRSRALGPGSGRALGLALLLALAAGVGAGLAVDQSGSHPVAGAASLKYGGIPSWIPKAKLPVGRLVQASAAHPWLAVEGDTVSVHLAGGAHLLATAVGPAVGAAEDSGSDADSDAGAHDTVPATFTVSLAHASARIPLSASEFRLMFEGAPLRGLVTSPAGGPPPRYLAPGQTVSLTVHAAVSDGGGALAFAPDGRRAIVTWAWSFEDD